ncbi:carboxylating nicotinate-nucleotide diphosphorylase [Anthocerotibacter panamensis]|uniref:carboxylating nicotinate-nucleotide diphosphorylase n=1 Tax=Anthocerotibacter panamensis TaxID=2857077 RepID=UPI001FD96E15|nr:carboxylating nicotinate-nucleotide diphosphorylase [Anthocerotibacter panamensis]
MAVLPPWLVIEPLLRQWLTEDWGRGDWTTASIFPQESPPTQAQLLLKQPGVVCGLPIVARIFTLVDPQIHTQALIVEGKSCLAGTVLARLEGPASAILMAERVALNILQRLSGIATLTRRYVEALAGTGVFLTDTRKTTPGLRLLEKYASRVGGATNHRLGLDDAVLIKDNHLLACGGVTPALRKARAQIPHLMRIEVECETLAQVEEALAAGADMILLDNMTIPGLEKAVALVARRVPLEASGNVTLENLQAIAQTGVDFIATSAPITRAPWLDISLDF